IACPFQITLLFRRETRRPDVLARLEVSLEVGAGTRVIQEAGHTGNSDVILDRPLNNSVYGQCIAFNTLHRAAQEILPAPLLGESANFVGQLFCEITHITTE